MLLSLMVLAALGFCVALYTYFVEKKFKENAQYKPVCDINDWVSCSRPLQSTYANIFYFSNAIAGMFFYGALVVLAALSAVKVIFIASLVAVIASVALAYLLFFKIRALCMLCTSLYIINILLLVLSFRAL